MPTSCKLQFIADLSLPSLTLNSCNWLGNKAWTEALQWPGKVSYNAAEYKDLISSIDGSNIGSVKSANNLTFIRRKFYSNF
jgi:carboxypeptidase C (cathepsin A)